MFAGSVPGLAAVAGMSLVAAAGCDSNESELAGDQVAAVASTAAGAPYVNDENFRHEVFESDLPVLVDFTATWCSPCKEVDPIVDELAGEMAGKAKVVKLDIDDSPEQQAAFREYKEESNMLLELLEGAQS